MCNQWCSKYDYKLKNKIPMTFLMVVFFFVLAERIPIKNIVASSLKGGGNPIIMWGHKYVTNYNFWLKESQKAIIGYSKIKYYKFPAGIR